MLNPSAVSGDRDASWEVETPLRAAGSIDFAALLPRVNASTTTTGTEDPAIGAPRPVKPGRPRLHLLQTGGSADRPCTSRIASVDRLGLILPKSRRVVDKRAAHLAALRYALLATKRTVS